MYIETKDLTLTYLDGENQRTILDKVNMKINAQVPNVLIGPSGSGKSSLLYLLAALRSQTSGVIDYSSITKSHKKSLDELRYDDFGFIFQKSFLLPYLNSIENICLARRDVNLKEEAVKWLDRFGISHLANKKPYQMSGGECQRIAIVRALVKKPKVIFADEPTASLDKDNAIQVFNILKELSRDKIMIVATHDTSLFSGDENIFRIENCKVIQVNDYK